MYPYKFKSTHIKEEGWDELYVDTLVLQKCCCLFVLIHSKDYFDPSEFSTDPIIGISCFSREKYMVDASFLRRVKSDQCKELPLGLYCISFSQILGHHNTNDQKMQPIRRAISGETFNLSLYIHFANKKAINVTFCTQDREILQIRSGEAKII
jgi:hypothetical protein